MEFNNPVFQTLLGLVIFYIGLKMFSGGMKSISHLEQLEWFLGNPYWMFLGAIVCTPVSYTHLTLPTIYSV